MLIIPVMIVPHIGMAGLNPETVAYLKEISSNGSFFSCRILVMWVVYEKVVGAGVVPGVTEWGEMLRSKCVSFLGRLFFQSYLDGAEVLATSYF